MRRTTTVLLTGLLALAGVAGCSDGKSYEEITADCAAALKDQAAGDNSKPEACEGVKDDDYKVLRLSQGLKDAGAVDESGNPDLDGLLDDATATP
ncbi:hypothetical protein [Streptomyces sp. WAC04114]|uniref:hypothetical protein n=1 Tax=Streptomyces sp. WAC04114 TaxID=2867961 RepID=UPI001C8B8103|nr:hypothetical protein [Streptomyces sp. WAC04114]MBX9365576.1 hypothetical protein [Streptomyces sp. WAC04114]